MFSLQIVCFKTTLTTSGFKRIKEHDGRNVFENKVRDQSSRNRELQKQKIEIKQANDNAYTLKEIFFWVQYLIYLDMQTKLEHTLKKSLPISIATHQSCKFFSQHFCMYVCMYVCAFSRLEYLPKNSNLSAHDRHWPENTQSYQDRTQGKEEVHSH